MSRTKRITSLLVLLLGASAASRADILTFDAADACYPAPCSNDDFISDTYGERLGVYFKWIDRSKGEQPGIRFWDDWGGSTGAIYAGVNNDDSRGDIRIIAKPGYEVTLYGFDLVAHGQDRESRWVIRDLEEGRLATSGGGMDVFASGPTTIASDFTSSVGFRIIWGSNAYNVGLDNLRFSVVSTASVPEPAPIFLFALGLAGLLLRKR